MVPYSEKGPLVSTGPPVITVAPPPVILVNQLHKGVTLQCAARGSPAPSLEWSKDGEVLTSNRTTHGANEVIGELVLSKFAASDQGEYTCFFRNYENGTAKASTTASKTELLRCYLCNTRVTVARGVVASFYTEIRRPTMIISNISTIYSSTHYIIGFPVCIKRFFPDRHVYFLRQST